MFRLLSYHPPPIRLPVIRQLRLAPPFKFFVAFLVAIIGLHAIPSHAIPLHRDQGPAFSASSSDVVVTTRRELPEEIKASPFPLPFPLTEVTSGLEISREMEGMARFQAKAVSQRRPWRKVLVPQSLARPPPIA